MNWIELREYEPVYLEQEKLAVEDALRLLHSYDGKITVEFPSPKSNYCWILRSMGVVGYLPLNEKKGLYLKPKVPIHNVYMMLSYSYELNDVLFLEEHVECETLQEVYELLALKLARQVLKRTKNGIYREYQEQREELPYLRGRMDVQQAMRQPWNPKLTCEFEEHQADIEDNHILYWTLYKILQSGFIQERNLPLVRRAYRGLQPFVNLQKVTYQLCLNRLYNRLNLDYKPMHLLCLLFLQNIGPTHQIGETKSVPFLIDMAALFERFVAKLLANHLPFPLQLNAQEHITIGKHKEIQFFIDLVILDSQTREVKYVLDTKYKTHEKPSASDVSQVVTYALAKDCNEAILIYPSKETVPINEYIGDIKVKSCVIDISNDLEKCRQEIMEVIRIN
ncbi:hypothetical protein QA612_22085 [Evansella sp. AB-P1]|uniref:McrC family protein n=1 Tax=Evansella sp. AB-P1 TaxID=3037653 RepID=UPI00241FED3A|nr:hypothetical protein [Evansella sp. AB-P1]MDG5790134.1 hypothetical protein [Evansella sp. AB-P1]